MNTENLLAVIKGLDPHGSWSGIGSIFGMMEICEDEITKAQPPHPEQRKIVWWDGVKLLGPSAYVHDAPEPVYRAHCAELLARVAQGLNTTLGTKAEVMVMLSEASLRSPLMHTAGVLYARIFQEIYPDSPLKDSIGQLAEMDFDRATEALLAEFSKACQDPGRKLARTKGK